MSHRSSKGPRDGEPEARRNSRLDGCVDHTHGPTPPGAVTGPTVAEYGPSSQLVARGGGNSRSRRRRRRRRKNKEEQAQSGSVLSVNVGMDGKSARTVRANIPVLNRAPPATVAVSTSLPRQLERLQIQVGAGQGSKRYVYHKKNALNRGTAPAPAPARRVVVQHGRAPQPRPQDDPGPGPVPTKLASSSVSKPRQASQKGHRSAKTPVAAKGGSVRPITGGTVRGPGIEAHTPRKARTFYPEHLSLDLAVKQIKSGALVEGSIRINAHNINEAFVSVEQFAWDVQIHGRQQRNRALDGDRVAVRLLDQKLWKKVKSASLSDRPTESQKMEKAPSQRALQPVGVVVAILEQNNLRVFVGCFEDDPSAKAKKFQKGLNSPGFITFTPYDRRAPRMSVPLSQYSHFLGGSKVRNQLFSVRLQPWDASHRVPIGSIESLLGEADSLTVQTQGLLSEASMLQPQFNPAIENEARAYLTVGDTEKPQFLLDAQKGVENRLDMRCCCLGSVDGKLVQTKCSCDPEHRGANCAVCSGCGCVRTFTIDPATAKDLDDALSVKVIPASASNPLLLEIGVHIADVSYFVCPNTAMDAEALRRGTTIYLIDRAIPMLPRVLCEDLCSLNAGQKKMAFSVIWRINPLNSEVVSEWIGRTVILSCAKLAYEHAQDVISAVEGAEKRIQERVQQDLSHPRCADVSHGIVTDIKSLWGVAKQLRKKRQDNGSLRLQNVKLRFVLNDQGLPISCSSEVQREANHLVEEFMLLANITVARRIMNAWPQQALLRRHPPPDNRRLIDISNELQKHLGVFLDISGSGSLQQSLLAATAGLPAHARQILEQMLTKPMQPAAYFCTDDVDPPQWRHYALSVGYYTHFTSPIRRYADIVVHRLLVALLEGSDSAADSVPPSSVIRSIASQCNKRKLAAKLAQEGSERLFLCHMLKNRVARVCAAVQEVSEKAVTLLILPFGVEQRIYPEDLEWSDSFVLNNGSMVIHPKESIGKKDLSLSLLTLCLVDVGSHPAHGSHPASLDVSFCHIDIQQSFDGDVHYLEYLHV